MKLQHTLQFHIPHSCFPNCAINSRNKITLLREISKGEQLTIDYATLFTGGFPTFICNCGHNGCRGKVLGFNFLPVIYQDYYIKNDAVSPEVLKTFAGKFLAGTVQFIP